MTGYLIPKDVDKLVWSLLVVLVEFIVDGENDTGFSPGLDEFGGDAGTAGIEKVTDSKVDVVVSDMAVNTTGIKDIDAIYTGELAMEAMNFAKEIWICKEGIIWLKRKERCI